MKEVQDLTHLCKDNNLLVNASMSIANSGLWEEAGKKLRLPYYQQSSVTRVDSFKYLDAHIMIISTDEITFHCDCTIYDDM